MGNLIHPEDLAVDRQLQQEANPVSRTAEMTLFQLAADGNREAAEIAGKLGLTFEGTQAAGSERMTPEDMIAFRMVLEVRYRVMERLAEESGCCTVADLPCGYTPMAVTLSRRGKRYVGMDLPAVVSAVKEIIPPMIAEENRQAVRFTAVDATNDNSMEAAFSETEGSLCIVTSGLLMYFSDSEADAMLRCVKKALDRYGGCWITADPEVELQHFSILQALCGDRFDRVMRERTNVIEIKSDTPLGQNALMLHRLSREQDLKRAAAFLEARGLRAERLTVADWLGKKDPPSFSLAGPEQREAVRKVFRETAFWRITSAGPAPSAEKDPAAETGKRAAKRGPDFRIRAERKGDLLELELAGRLDTLSAPDLLALYKKEAAEGGLRKVVFHCRQLSFVSSAGLRVLLMIRKACRDGVFMAGMNNLVREIIDQTGFTPLLADASGAEDPAASPAPPAKEGAKR